MPGQFTPSAFVASVTGVDNVCERSAVKASGGTLLLPKTAGGGVTGAGRPPLCTRLENRAMSESKKDRVVVGLGPGGGQF